MAEPKVKKGLYCRFCGGPYSLDGPAEINRGPVRPSLTPCRGCTDEWNRRTGNVKIIRVSRRTAEILARSSNEK